MKFIALGVVGKPFGLRGETRVKPFNPRTEWFDQAEGVWLRDSETDEPQYFKVLHCRRHQEFFLLTLAGIRDVAAAETIRGRTVVAPEDSLLPLAENEYYWHQLIGLRVETAEGREAGEVIRLEETSPELDGNDVLVVRGEGGELLIPLADSAIAAVDLAGGKIVIHPEFLAPAKPSG